MFQFCYEICLTFPWICNLNWKSWGADCACLCVCSPFLQTAYKEWGNFRLYHQLFFHNQSFGPGGYNADTASGDDDASAADAHPAERGKTSRADDSDASDNEPGKKPCRETTRSRSGSQGAFMDMYSSLQVQMMESEENRELERQKFEMKMAEERRQWEEKRDAEREEREERREMDRRAYEERRAADRERHLVDLRQSEREFNANLLARLFGK